MAMPVIPISLTNLPSPCPRNIAIRVTPAAENALRRGHPWCYEEAITSQSHEGSPGDLAVIFGRDRRFLAVGLYDPTSIIRVRILQHGKPAEINQDWLSKKLSQAAQLRVPLMQLLDEKVTTGFRLVHGENDGLPGLVIDRYADTLVGKLYTAAWLPHFRKLYPALAQVHPHKRLILRLSRKLQEQPAFLYGLTDGMLLDGPELDGPALFHENGLIFEADPVYGQKTGFFLDQRENRARVGALSYGKTVLNLFAYTGGFSVYAARGGARQVLSVDQSQPACRATERNMARNSHLPAVAAAFHETIAGDVFTVLAEMACSERLFDLVILDPPTFAHKQTQIASAVSAYQQLTRLGLGVLRSGGILVQASCSSHVDAKTFFSAVHQAAREVKRPLQEIERTSHPPDHPITFPEGAYLKCLFTRVA